MQSPSEEIELADFLYRLHSLKSQPSDNRVFSFCVDWLIETIVTSARSGEALPAGVVQLVGRNQTLPNAEDEALLVEMVTERLAARRTATGGRLPTLGTIKSKKTKSPPSLIDSPRTA